MSLSNISISICINLFGEKSVKYEALMNKFFNFLKTNLHILIHLYIVFFLINSINGSVISE